jgi:DNA repair protein RecO (recombination protein O)
LNIELESAFILHQRSYRETSILLDIFSQSYGRVSLVAKGVRKHKRSQQGFYQLYQPVLLSWFNGRGDLHPVTAIEQTSGPYSLKGQASLCGLYINELLVRLLPLKEAEPHIFQAYQMALSELEQSDDIEVTLRLFEKRLLSHLGYGLVIDVEAETGKKIEPNKVYFYHPDSGLYLWYDGAHYPAISGKSLNILNNETGFDPISLKEIKQLMRSVIQFYLGDKVLNSRQLFSSQYNVNSKG